MAHSAWKNNAHERKDLYRQSVGDGLDVWKQDQLIKSDPGDNKRRRTVVINRQTTGKSGQLSCGFTLQSYGLLNRKSHEIELLTYVDYVDINGPAHVAGLRPGDVILSVNGVPMEKADHKTLVNFIQSSGSTLRMVVLFEDCCRKIELYRRRMKLQQILEEKIRELRRLEEREAQLMHGFFQDSPSGVYYSGSEGSLLSVSDSYDLDLSPDSIVESNASFYLQSGAASDLSGHPLSFEVRHSLKGTADTNLTSPTSLSLTLDPVSLPNASDDQYSCNSLPISLSKKKKKQRQDRPSPLTADATASLHSSRPVFRSVSGEVFSSSPEAGVVPLQSTPKSIVEEPIERPGSLSSMKQPVVTSPAPSTAVNPLTRLRGSFQHQISADFRYLSNRAKREIADHVPTEKTSPVNMPQLVSLKRLCNDFRRTCVQQYLEQRRKSIDWMASVVEQDPFDHLGGSVSNSSANSIVDDVFDGRNNHFDDNFDSAANESAAILERKPSTLSDAVVASDLADSGVNMDELREGLPRQNPLLTDSEKSVNSMSEYINERDEVTKL